MLGLDPNLRIALALLLTISGPVILMFKMLDHEPKVYVYNTNPKLNFLRVMNWWGVGCFAAFVAGIALFFA